MKVGARILMYLFMWFIKILLWVLPWIVKIMQHSIRLCCYKLLSNTASARGLALVRDIVAIFFYASRSLSVPFWFCSGFLCRNCVKGLVTGYMENESNVINFKKYESFNLYMKLGATILMSLFMWTIKILLWVLPWIMKIMQHSIGLCCYKLFINTTSVLHNEKN